MVLRLFSKSSKTETPAPSTTAVPGPDASQAELVEAAKAATTTKSRTQLIGRIENPGLLRELASHEGCLAACADRIVQLDSLQAALAVATTDETRTELAIHTHSADLRSAQIDALASEEALVALEHASRSKNKACNRMARERIEALKSARTNAAEASQLAKDLATSAQRLENDDHVAARFAALAQKHASAAETHARSQAFLDEFNEKAPPLQPMPDAPELEPVDAADTGPDFRALADEFVGLEAQLRGGASALSIAPAMTAAAANWRGAIAQATPNGTAIDKVASCSSLFESLHNCETLMQQRTDGITQLLAEKPALDAQSAASLKRAALAEAWRADEEAQKQIKQIKELSKGIHYPEGLPAPDALTALFARKSQLGELRSACAELKLKTESAFKEQVKHLAQALDAGELKRAEAARGEARSLQDALPAGSAGEARKRYGALIANMQNLRDWQHFATDPKRDELCEQMCAIADSPKEPDEQADLVKELRAQWNALGGKGPKEIAQRFDEAAARAFEPCRLHYAKLAEQREQNLQTRKNILEQLETFVSSTDWANADLAGARNILNSARTEWRAAFPVERGANRSLEKRFKATTDALYANLQEGWGENLAAKEKLVETAEALLDSDDPLPARLDAAKRLQQSWKQAGPVPRGPDQKLWKRFRSACDALFNARDEERTQEQEHYSAQQTLANTRLDEFEALLGEKAPEELDRSHLAALKRDLDAIEKLDRTVLSRARALEDAFQAKLKAKAAALVVQSLERLRALDVQAAESELSGQPVADEVRQEDSRFNNRSSGDVNAHLDLVLEAETQAGIESPASDAQRRMELQVQKLNAGMNSGAREARSAIELAQDWCALSATEQSQGLRDRLFEAARVLLTAG